MKLNSHQLLNKIAKLIDKSKFTKLESYVQALEFRLKV